MASSPVIDIPAAHATNEACLAYAQAWLGQPERTEEEVVALLRSIRARTQKDIAFIISAIALLCNDQDEVLLLRRMAKDRNYPGMWAFPGGQKDPEDNDLAAAARRELLEEAGLTGSVRQSHGAVYATIPKRQRVYQINAFTLSLDPGTSREIVLSDEHDKAAFLAPQAALEMDEPEAFPLAGRATRHWLEFLLKSNKSTI